MGDSYEDFQLIETAYSGKTLEQVSEIKRNHDVLVKNEAEEALQAKIRLLAFIEATAQQKQAPDQADIKGIRKNRKYEKRKKHKTIGGTLSDG